MLEEILEHIHNHFEVKGASLSGEFVVSSGSLTLSGLKDGQYFWIKGSVFNDGLHEYPATNMTNEAFTGTITYAAIPPALIALSGEISEWVAAHPETGKTSESFGGYSYSKGTSKTGAPVSWQEVFAARLNRWRKLS